MQEEVEEFKSGIEVENSDANQKKLIRLRKKYERKITNLEADKTDLTEVDSSLFFIYFFDYLFCAAIWN